MSNDRHIVTSKESLETLWRKKMNPNNLFTSIRHFLFIGIVLSFLTTCNITGSLDSSKKFGGLLSFITTYTSLFDNALLELTGTLVAEDGVTPISNGTLVINYQLLNVSSKAKMDSNVTTDSSGNFKMNLNVGKFTITVFSSSGENLGYFTVTITSSTGTPNVEKNGRFGVNNLAIKPISTSTCSNGASLCGFITGASSGSGKFFVFGSSSESNTSSNTPVIYETSDGVTFTKNKVTLGSCVPSNSTSSNTECRITSVGYDGSTYFVMGVKSTCIANSSCNTSNTYAGKGSSLGSITINEVTAPTIFNDSSQNYVYANGVFHYISFSSAPNIIYSSSNGTSFTNSQLPTSGTSPLQTSCQNLYIGESGYPFCGFRYYYDGSWKATTTSVSNSISAATLSNFRGSYNKAFYQILTFDTSTLTSGIYNTSGSLIPGGNFSSNSSSKFNGTGSMTPLFSTTNYIFGFLANITAGSPSTPSVLNSIGIVRSSDNGATYTSSGITLPVTITYPMGFGSTNSYIFLAGYVRESNNVTRSYLFRSADGTTWTTVTLP
jgi:hypothetical protein